jgi:DNA-binding transcriptional LysR family regulator
VLDPTQFTSVVVGEDVLLPVCAPDANGAPRWTLPGHPETPWPFLSYDRKSGLGRILSAVWAKESGALSFKKGFTAQLAAALLSMARQGQGIAWSPESLATEDIKAGRLVDPGFGRFSVNVEIRLFRPVHGQARTAEAFWKAIPNVVDKNYA